MSGDIDFNQFIKELKTVGKIMAGHVEQGLNENAEDLLSASQKLAPLDQGFLMDSGSVDPSINQNGEVVARVGFSTEYAAHMENDFYELGEKSKQKSNFDGMSVGRGYLKQPTQKYGQKYADHLSNKMQEAWENE